MIPEDVQAAIDKAKEEVDKEMESSSSSWETYTESSEDSQDPE